MFRSIACRTFASARLPSASEAVSPLLSDLGITKAHLNAGALSGATVIDTADSSPLTTHTIQSPIDGTTLASVAHANADQVTAVIGAASAAQRPFASLPPPARGEFCRVLAQELRTVKPVLGQLLTLEVGKITSEAEGEIQEMIDMLDLAVGQSRQLFGKAIASERVDHRMMEQYHPLGTIGVISAFNFPVAVWSWNLANSVIMGNATVWKCHEQTPLVSFASSLAAVRAAEKVGIDPALFGLVIGKANPVGTTLVDDPRISLISATGSCRMGKEVAIAAAQRYARTILELGGNNALVVTPSANMELAERAILFGAVGTAGQRCTSTRRLIVHRSVSEKLVTRLTAAYKKVRIGDPRDSNTLLGPLHSEPAVQAFLDALRAVPEQGGEVLTGGEVVTDLPGGRYVTPALCRVPADASIMKTETFAPILYVIEYGNASSSPSEAVDELAEAISLNNDVPQGLSSAIFTDNVREAEMFTSPAGSDCGIANVNLGTSGAEVGGSFGGEKETGGGREAGSDAWKTYARRTTSTTNYGSALPLAQGVSFDL